MTENAFSFQRNSSLHQNNDNSSTERRNSSDGDNIEQARSDIYSHEDEVDNDSYKNDQLQQ